MNLTNTSFKLFFIEYEDGYKKHYIPFSTYKDYHQNPFGSFNEKLTEKENSQFSLTFDMSWICNGVKNIFIDYLVIDREIRLELGEEVIDFVITSKSPKFSKNNITYSYSCQDIFSYYASKQRNNISLSTDNEEDWENKTVGPRDINTLVNKVLSLSSLNDWSLDPDLNSTIIHFPDNLYSSTTEMKVSLELTNTTPYNAFIEIAKLFNALIKLDFKNKIIYFKNKETIPYSGLTLRPETNLSQFSYGEKGDNLYNIMHVSGSEDSYGELVTILPAIPNMLATILINTVTPVNNFSPYITQEEYYLKPYFVNYNGTLYVRKKQIIDEYYGQYISIDYDIWTQAEDNFSLQNYINSYISELDPDDYSGQDLEDIQYFFNELRFTPYAQSFLMDFSYWRDSGLLSAQRYEELNEYFMTTFRNTNLLLMAYNTLYVKLKYELNKIISQEEELVAAIAADDELRATLDQNTKIDTSSYYIAHSVKADFEDETSSYFLPIGVLNNNTISYGEGEGLLNVCYNLPDLDNIINQITTFYTIDASSNKVLKSYSKISANILLNQIIINGTGHNILIYVNYNDIKDLENINLDTEDSVDYWLDLEMFNSQSKINNLHNMKYYYLHEVLYGKNWLSNRITDIQQKIKEYEIEKGKILSLLEQKFGTNWQTLDESYFNNMELYAEFSDLKVQLSKIQLQIGGQGTRIKNNDKSLFLYKGYLNHYLILLESLNTTYNNTAVEENGLEKRVEYYKQEQENNWKEFYSEYKDIVRETKYEDSTQLSSRGLYLAAEKQFFSYKQPTKSYSSSILTTKDLMEGVEQIEIGDLIHIIHPGINMQKLDDCYDIYLSHDLQNDNKIVTILTKQGVAFPENILLKDYCFIRIKKSNTSSYEVSDITGLITGNQLYKYSACRISDTTAEQYNTPYKILSFENSQQIQPVTLRITSISKTLRENVAQLSVEENTLYNSLVDRLITILK